MTTPVVASLCLSLEPQAAMSTTIVTRLCLSTSSGVAVSDLMCSSDLYNVCASMPSSVITRLDLVRVCRNAER